ncbi:hypothetical protein H4582DRAFT_855262 [Lactarius indigo]|nr:hypothetical protein H4582DRAFT_855262 [Lactarius indigo]
MSEKIQEFLEIPQEFIREGNQFLVRCTKPSQKEFVQISKAVAIGFAVMGFIGYLVKLIHIPINNILVYVYVSYCPSHGPHVRFQRRRMSPRRRVPCTSTLLQTPSTCNVHSLLRRGTQSVGVSVLYFQAKPNAWVKAA